MVITEPGGAAASAAPAPSTEQGQSQAKPKRKFTWATTAQKVITEPVEEKVVSGTASKQSEDIAGKKDSGGAGEPEGGSDESTTPKNVIPPEPVAGNKPTLEQVLAKAGLTEADTAATLSIDDLNFATSKFLNYVEPGAAETRKFSVQSHNDLYRQLRQATDILIEMQKTGKAPDNITYLLQMAKGLLCTDPAAHEITDANSTALRKRGEAVLKLRSERGEKKKGTYYLGGNKDKEAIFATPEQIIQAVAVTETASIIEQQALALKVTAGGTRPIEVKLNAFDVTTALKKTYPNIKDRAIEALMRDDKKLLKILAAEGAAVGGGVLGGVLSQSFGGAVEGAIITNLITGAAGGVAALSRWDFVVGRKGDELTITINTIPSTNKVITEFGQRSPAMGMTSSAELTAYLQGREQMIQQVYREMGLDIRDPDKLGMISLDPAEFDPAANTVTSGVGRLKFINERQLALDQLLKERNVTSLFDFKPEETLDVILKSFDIAAQRTCETAAKRIRAQLDFKERARQVTRLDSLEEEADVLETGKSSSRTTDEYVADVKTRRRTLDDQKKKQELVAKGKGDLKDILDKIGLAQAAVVQAQRKRDDFNEQFDRPPAAGQRGRYSDLLEQRKTVNSEISRLEGQIHGLDGDMERNQRRIDEPQGQIEELEGHRKDDEYRGINSRDPRVREPVEERWSVFERDNIAPLKRQQTIEKRLKQQAESRKQSATNRLARENARKTGVDGELKPLQEKRDAAYEPLGDAQEKLAQIERQRDEILRQLGWDGSAATRFTYEQVVEMELAVVRDVDDAQEALKKAQDALQEFNKSGKTEASAEDKTRAIAKRVAARLLRTENSKRVTKDKGEIDVVGRFNAVTGAFVDGEVSFSEFGDWEAALRHILGNATAAEYEVFQRMATRADAVLTAIDVYSLDADAFFGRNERGTSRYEGIRHNLGRITELRSKIEDLRVLEQRAIGNERTVLNTEITNTRNNLQEIETSTFRSLSENFDRVRPLLNSDPWKARDFVQALIYRTAAKAESADPFSLVSTPPREVKIGREIGQTIDTPVGRVSLEAQRISGNVEVFHSRINLDTTSAHYKPPGQNYELQATVDAAIKKPENQAAADSIDFSLSLRLTPDIYNSLPPAPPPTPPYVWPNEVINTVYDGTRKKEMGELPMGQYVTGRVNFERSEAILGYLESFTGLGDLKGLMSEAVGRMLLQLSPVDRTRFFQNFTAVTTPELGSNIVTFTIERDAIGNFVSGTTPLTDFIQGYEAIFKRMNNITPETPLDNAQRTQMSTELRNIIRQIGEEALKALQRY